MSSSVDDRIVSMQFDNASFQRKLAETISSLDKLRASLDFAASTRGLNDLNTASKNFNMSGISNGIDGVSTKFLALATIGITALAHITEAAITAGTRMVSAFTFDPIRDGFSEFETNMNSIQTILANTNSKGTTLDDVNAALLQLNQYSDKTIYNFTQMARNIGTFTAAGVDLDASVNAIKGIANLAAISGSNSEQASTAMYQLSQALASGSVKLMDWNSVVNAGMGGEVFQKALFETGKALGTIKDVPMAQTFDEWKDAGNTFRETLQDGWITADVLTNTLAAFTGDLTEAQLMSMGYTQQQAAELAKLGQLGNAAATEVKTLTQLLSTVKEAIASGWTQSFQIILGDFNEAKGLFTSMSTAIGKVVSTSATARNQLLSGWKAFGGRDLLIEGLTNAVSAFGKVITPIRDALRDIFPPVTVERLVLMTQSFAKFTENLKIGGGTALRLQSIFRGFFAAIEIGWTIFKEILGLIGDLIGELLPAGSKIFQFGADTGDAIFKLNAALVAGGGIHDFFENLKDKIQGAIDFVLHFKDVVVDLFTNFQDSKAVEDSIDRVNSRLETLSSIPDKISEAWDRLRERFSGVFEVLDDVLQAIKDWFGSLGSKIAEAFQPGDFDAAVDTINVGLLGGIALLLRRFLSGGVKIDFGGGLIDKIKNTFDSLTETLGAMQAKLKAETLLKIAEAIGILVASLVVLSLIDSDKLTKALVALSFSFGELIGALTLLDRINFDTSIVKLGGLATVMILMAVAVGILSLAVQNLSNIDLGDLAKGLGGVAVGLGLLVAATRLISADSEGLISAGISMGLMAGALYILSKAVASFSDLSWGEMAKGLVGVAGGLLAITTAMRFMPPSSAISGLGFIEMAIGLRILFEAVKAFSTISWAEMAKGLAGIFGSLLIVTAAMEAMPITLPITAGGMILLAGALYIMAKAVAEMGQNDLGTLAKGIGSIAALLLILVAAMQGMSGALPGAAALVVVSGALLVLTKVLEQLGQLSIGQLATAIGAIAIALGVLGAASLLLEPAIPLMLGLGVAIGVLGTGFALFGVGAFFVAKALETLAVSGVAGIKALIEGGELFVKAMPGFLQALFDGAKLFLQDILNSMPLLFRLLKAALLQLLDTIIEIVPKIIETLGTIITEFLGLVKEKFPEIIDTGYQMLLAFLKGIRDNIKEVVETVADIIINFLDALREKIPEIVDSLYNLILTIIEQVILKFSGIGLLLSPKGRELLGGLLTGVGEALPKIGSWFAELPGKIISFIGNLLGTLIPKGLELIGGLLTGLGQKIGDISSWFISLPGKIVGWIGNLLSTLTQKGIDLLQGFLLGLIGKVRDIVTWFTNLPRSIISWIGDLADTLVNVGREVIDGLWRGMKEVWDDVTGWLSNLNPANWFNDINPYKGHARLNLAPIGKDVFVGLHVGMKEGWNNITSWLKTLNPSETFSIGASSGLNDILNKIVNSISGMDEFNPTITPVLDLSKVQAEAGQLNQLFNAFSLNPSVSISRARLISTTAEIAKTSEDSIPSGDTTLTFEQTINSPTPLSTNDIYRNTKSQIVLAKEALGIS